MIFWLLMLAELERCKKATALKNQRLPLFTANRALDNAFHAKDETDNLDDQ